MFLQGIPRLRTWSYEGQTQSLGTPIFQGIDPYCALDGSTKVYGFSGTKPNWGIDNGYIHVTQIKNVGTTTVQKLSLMRPKNFCLIAAAVAKNATTIVVDADPGIYSTNWRYPAAPGGIATPATQPTTGSYFSPPCNVADRGIATNDYIAVQMDDGTWLYRKITNVSTLTLTIAAVPNVTGGTISKGNICFFFGLSTDTDPNNGRVHPFFYTNGTAGEGDFIDYTGDGLATTLHPGDPMIYYDPNATAADTLVGICGYYGKT
jgi:hypothetical protein